MFRRFPPSRQRVLSVAIAAALGGLQASTALAAETPATTESQQALPEVRVKAKAERESSKGPVNGIAAKRSATGTKTDTPLIETPQSLSVISREELELRGVSDIKQAVGYTPGVTPVIAVDRREDLTTFRGFEIDWATVYLDGLAMPYTRYGLAMGEPYGMERIEVLRGPSSTLYGQTSTGGLINLVSKRPTATPIREVQFTWGVHNRKQMAFDLAGSLGATDEWTYRLTGLIRRADTDVDYVEDNRVYIAPALTWKPSASTSLTLLLNHLSDDLGDSGGTAAFLPASGIFLPNPNGRLDRSTYGGEPSFDFYKKKQYSFGYEFDHRFNDVWAFRQNVRYRTTDLDYQTAFGLGGAPVDAAQRVFRRGKLGSFADSRALTIDNQWQADWSTGSTQHKTLLGLDYREAKTHDQIFSYFAAPNIDFIDLFDPVYGVAITVPPFTSDQSDLLRQTGLYVQHQANFDQRWILTAGARSDHALNESTLHHAGDLQLRRKDEKTTGRVGLTYMWNTTWSAYAMVSTSFTPTSGVDAQLRPFKPKEGKQHEVGIKHQSPDGKSLYTAALFHIDQKNGVTSDPDNPANSVQTGKFRSKGLELEAKTSVTNALRVIGAYTYVDANTIRSNDGNLGKSPKGTSPHTASAWMDYAFATHGIPGLSAGAGVRYVGKRKNSDTPAAFTLPDFAVFDASVRYETGAYTLALHATNLADKTTYDCWYAKCWYGPGRDIRASLTIRW